MAIDQLSQFRLCLRVHKLLLLALGFYPFKKPILLYWLLPYVHITLMTLKTVGIIGSAIKNIKNILALCFQLMYTISYTTATLKIICMVIYREEIKEVSEILNGHFNAAIKNAQSAKAAFINFNTIRRLTWTLWILIFSTASVSIILPLTSLIYQYTHGINPIKYTFPAHSVYPWPITPGGFMWWLHYWCEIFAVCSIIISTSCFDAMYIIYVFLMMAQLRVISYRMSHLDEINDINDTVRDCIFQQKIVLQCQKKLEKIFGVAMLWAVIVHAIATCVAIFQLSQSKFMSTLNKIFVIGFTLMKLLQTYVIGYIGTQITIESENLREAVYSSNWHGNKQLMTSIPIMLVQRPIIITVCKFYIISVDIFRMTLNTGISYFFLLQTLQS